jgi:hypothetical protein
MSEVDSVIESVRRTAQLQKLDRIIFPEKGNYLWGALSGDGNSSRRQAVMEFIYGVKRPKSKCGLTEVMRSLAAYCGAEQGMPSQIESHILATLKGSR